MEIKKLNTKPNHSSDQKFPKHFDMLVLLLNELSEKELPEHVVDKINTRIDQLNVLEEGDKNIFKAIRKAPAQILNITEKEVKLVAKNHYRNTWLVLGLSAFGIPLGHAFSMSLGNMAFVGIGMPIGMVIGMGLGTSMDKKAKTEGRQLSFEM